MASYSLNFKPSVEKDLGVIPSHIRKNIWHRTLALAWDPRPPQAAKLTGTRSSWRLRCDAYRVLYSIDDGSRLVIILAVKHRREAYR